ncbi:conjugal transfer protein TraG N-terminal domain-containing protein [Pasteurella testudinis]|uniref:conjugal transfer protein TraG N-terminal domain-containing protein n=1 Tax=Pasteurella testudinis TaxID=761 RepID=UPI0040591831
MNMYVNSYFEYFLTLLSWIINNALWHVFTETGLFATPFLAHLVRLWLKVREEGDDEGNKGKLLLARLEHVFYVSLVVIFFTCVPMLKITIHNIKMDVDRSKQCGYTIVDTANTQFSNVQTEMSGKSASVPIWWGFTHTLNKAVTQAAVASIPCKPDLRQIRFDVQHTKISSPVLLQEVRDFVEQCFVPARTKIKRQQIELNEVQARDVDWIGSNLLLTSEGLYDSYRSHAPRKQWAYNATRDAGLPNTGDGGFPTCKQWWSDDKVGLKSRLLAEFKPGVLGSINKLFSSKKDYEDSIIRSLVRPENIEVSTGNAYSGYGGSVDFSLSNAFSRVASFVGMTAGATAAFPAFDAMRQALPMVQGFLIMALVICIPLVTLFSAYDIKVIMTMTFIQFGLFFLSFWWELARWLITDKCGHSNNIQPFQCSWVLPVHKFAIQST